MKIILKNFFKGMLIGLLFLPLEFSLLSLTSQPVQAQQSLGEEIRSQTADPRDIREEVPCEDESREGCARPIPSRPPHREPCGREPCVSPEPSWQPEPSPPGPSGPPGPPPSPGVGGPPSEEGEEGEGEEEAKAEAVKAPVVGLPYTGSGKW